MSAVLREVMKEEEPFPIDATSDIVIIEQKTDHQSKGGIVLVGDSRRWPQGRVVSCGPGRTYAFHMDASGVTMAGHTLPMVVKVGDYVFLGKYQSGGEPIEINGKRYLVCREGDVLGISRAGEFIEVKLVAPDP